MLDFRDAEAACPQIHCRVQSVHVITEWRCCVRVQDLPYNPPKLDFQRSRYGHGLMLAEQYGLYFMDMVGTGAPGNPARMVCHTRTWWKRGKRKAAAWCQFVYALHSRIFMHGLNEGDLPAFCMFRLHALHFLAARRLHTTQSLDARGACRCSDAAV